MKLKTFALALALSSASLFSLSAAAAPLACPEGDRVATVKGIAPDPKYPGVTVVTMVSEFGERQISMTADDLKKTAKKSKVKRVTPGIQICEDEAKLM